MPAPLVSVNGTDLLAGDPRDRYRQKLARITLDSMVQFVGLLDAEGTVLEINRVALDAVGIEIGDVEGRPFWTTFWWQVSEPIRDELKAAIQRAAQGEFVRWDTEIYGRAGGKETITIDASLCPVHDDRGRVVFITAEGRDITEKKAHEREIARQREELAQLDELKTQFFANISHEFRTPLTLMLGPIEDALADADDALDPPQRARIAMVQRNGLRLMKLVNALLDFSRVAAGRIQAVYQPTDLAALTHDLASSFRAACERAGLTLAIETPPLPQPVYVDHEMWEKIVLNLLSNAFKFTLDGGIRAELAAEGGEAVLRISDTGTGIAAGELPRIFDRFHRVAGARGRTHEGTGIGLALVKELIELHKGSVAVESVPEQGTTFTVRLPFGSVHLPQDRLQAARTQVSTATGAEAFVGEALRWLPDGIAADAVALGRAQPPAGAERARLLLADDNADMRDYLRRLLDPEYEVIAVADGEAALQEARRARPDLILTDVMMPRLDGFGLLAALREDAELRGVPVIVLSARAGEEAKVEGLRAGADDYLVKPFSARELLARVGTNIELSRTRTDSARVLREEAQLLEVLNRLGTEIAAELDLERAVQVVTDAATSLSGAAFGAFFYTIVGETGEAYTLYTLSGARREDFAGFPTPRKTAVFGPTFDGAPLVRSDDITLDPRYGANPPYHGMPNGHLPVRSYMATAVKARSGEVIGGLFFGHPDAGVFNERAARIVDAIAVQAGIAIDRARLYRAAQDEIARRERVEAALRESERTLEAKVAERTAERDSMWKLSRDLMLVADLDGHWLSVNPAAGDILGRPPATLLGKTSAWLDHPDDPGQMRAALARLACGEPVAAFENRLRHADGGWRWLSWTAVADAGRIYVTGRDVTAEKEAAAELERTQDALRQFAKMEAVGQLTGGIAHDFNNLLTIIIGNLESLQRHLPEPGPERLRRSAQNAMQGAQRAAALTQRLLAFSRRQPLDPKPVDCNKLVAGMGDLLTRTLGEQTQIETVLAGGLWRTEVDANQLENALLNLAVNARDAMPQGGKLTIETANTHLDELYATRAADVLPGQYVLIAVTDTGSGMAPDVIAHAFEPFFTTKPIGQGTGLGLPQVYGFVKQSGGHIKICSEPGEGTSIQLYLPRLLGDAMADEEQQAPAIPDGRSSETVLIVEDEQMVREYTTELLAELGYGVLQANNGANALALLERHRVDLLLTDVGLPGINGRQLADEARRRQPGLKVLFSTGYTPNATTHHGRLDPDVQMIGKPFTYAGLAAKVREALDSS